MAGPVCIPVALLWRAVWPSNGLDADDVRDRAAAEKWFEENEPEGSHPNTRFWIAVTAPGAEGQ